MAILDLDKIIFQKTNEGITCPNCGGNLNKIDKRTLIDTLVTTCTLGTKKLLHYQCENCRKKYIVM